jgi:hypothetical protein
VKAAWKGPLKSWKVQNYLMGPAGLTAKKMGRVRGFHAFLLLSIGSD